MASENVNMHLPYIFTCSLHVCSISSAENALLVNGGSPNPHLMQSQIALSPVQTFSPLKTRRMRQGLSNSEPQLKRTQDVHNSNQGWSNSYLRVICMCYCIQIHVYCIANWFFIVLSWICTIEIRLEKAKTIADLLYKLQ